MDANNPSLSIRTARESADSPTYSFTALLDNQPLGIGYMFRWEFGDGAFSDLPNPVHTFPDTGSYQVRVMISKTGDGGKDISDKTASSAESQDSGADSGLPGIFSATADLTAS